MAAWEEKLRILKKSLDLGVDMTTLSLVRSHVSRILIRRFNGFSTVLRSFNWFFFCLLVERIDLLFRLRFPNCRVFLPASILSF